MLPQSGGYDALYAGFQWDLPRHLNMARQACFDWLDQPDRVAIIDLSGGGRTDLRYGDLARMTRALAAQLAGQGVRRGDRVGVLRSQDGWCAAAHLAAWTLGAVSVPLFKLFGPDALAVRMADSGAAVVVTDAEGVQKMAAVDSVAPAVLIPEALDLADADLAPVDTGPEDPAILIYTSGTTGAPKGALHGHRVLTGHLPGVEISHDRLGQPGDVIWTPADWAWIGGLFDVLMPGLALGVTVVAARLPKFTPEAARDVITRGGVRNVFFPPTALKLLKAADLALPGLRSVASGGEPLGAEMLAWGRAAFGLDINEFYGQTECNMIASSAGSLFPPRPGCIGKPVPGHDLAVLGPDGPLPEGHEGDIAVRRGSASMLLEYWNRPEATAEKFRGDWLLTGDLGVRDEDGYFWYRSRADDVITSAGYRIGPGEIEEALLRHPAVRLAAAIGVPDAVRTESIKAFLVLAEDQQPTDALAQEIREFVKTRLARHEYPRDIEFVDALPTTTTGKIMRRELRERERAKAASGHES